jgi:hypothetical protein
VSAGSRGQEDATPDQVRDSERGRDLTLLALALIVINEGIFTAFVIAQDQDAIVAQAGRFALKAGLAWLTWQGFVISRWVLVLLVGAALLAAPWALRDAFAGGISPFALVLTATVAAYAAAGWLLAFSPHVSAFIRQRAVLRNRDVLK